MNTLHVGIHEPIHNRKEILKCSLSTIQLLKNFEELKRIRKEKEFYKKEFKKNLKELNTLFKEFDKLPKVHIKKEKKKSTVKKKEEKKVVHPTYIDKLEEDLAEIKARIDSL